MSHVQSGRLRYEAAEADQPPIRIRCFAFVGGSPIYGFSRSRRSNRCPTPRLSHPFIERLIGTIRREYFDRTIFWNSIDLHRKLENFRAYYNGVRVHRSLNGTTPANRAGHPSPSTATLAHYAWKRHCDGLFETPVAA
ncbi:MAG: integrase core domain-containing protein [Steroidobacteraceae bacterium]